MNANHMYGYLKISVDRWSKDKGQYIDSTDVRVKNNKGEEILHFTNIRNCKPLVQKIPNGEYVVTATIKGEYESTISAGITIFPGECFEVVL